MSDDLCQCPKCGRMHRDLGFGKPPAAISRDTVAVSGIHLFRVGEHVVVSVEINGQWVEVIRERHDGAFSHIVEPSGIRQAAALIEGLPPGADREPEYLRQRQEHPNE